MNKNEVNIAFEILLEEIEFVANQLNESGGRGFSCRGLRQGTAAIEEATRLADFREKVKALQREWAGLAAGGLKVRQPKPRRAAKGRRQRGLRTPEEAFRRPILEALVELGGSAHIGEVLERVGIKMKGVLKRYDREPLPSDPRSVRWKNTAQWCRNTLVSEGLMKNDSPTAFGRFPKPAGSGSLMKARSKELLDRAIAAMVAAIDVYNKLDFRYRAESFTILALNAWELLLKAKWLAMNRNRLSSLYVREGEGQQTVGSPRPAHSPGNSGFRKS